MKMNENELCLRGAEVPRLSTYIPTHTHTHTHTHTPTLPTSCYQDKKGSGGMGANRKKQLDLHTLQNTSFPVSSIHPTRNTTSPRPSLCQRSRMFHHHS